MSAFTKLDTERRKLEKQRALVRKEIMQKEAQMGGKRFAATSVGRAKLKAMESLEHRITDIEVMMYGCL